MDNLALGLVCGRCDAFSPLGTATCACGASLALGAAPAPAPAPARAPGLASGAAGAPPSTQRRASEGEVGIKTTQSQGSLDAEISRAQRSE